MFHFNYISLRSQIMGTLYETGPHKNWAEKILMRAQAYVVIENDVSYMDLFGV
jgi:hypothetical protein